MTARSGRTALSQEARPVPEYASAHHEKGDGSATLCGLAVPTSPCRRDHGRGRHLRRP
jgi:hypothetical protein